MIQSGIADSLLLCCRSLSTKESSQIWKSVHNWLHIYTRSGEADSTWCSIFQYVAVCCSVLQCVAVSCSVLQSGKADSLLLCCKSLPAKKSSQTVCCSVLQCVTVRRSVLQGVACIAVWYRVAKQTHCSYVAGLFPPKGPARHKYMYIPDFIYIQSGEADSTYCSVLQCAVVCCSVLQGVAGCCRVLQCVAVCCSVLQCVAVCCVYCSVIQSGKADSLFTCCRSLSTKESNHI